MARLLLLLQLLTCVVGSGGFVLCIESDSRVSLESLLTGCCIEETAGEHADAAPAQPLDDVGTLPCDCEDLPADAPFTRAAIGSDLQRHLPALQPILLPPHSCDAGAEGSCTLPANLIEAIVRLDLPGVGASPRILRT